MDELGTRVDEVVSNLLETLEALKAEHAQKNAEVDQLTRKVSDLEEKLAKAS